jgi:hypothetical protein
MIKTLPFLLTLVLSLETSSGFVSQSARPQTYRYALEASRRAFVEATTMVAFVAGLAAPGAFAEDLLDDLAMPTVAEVKPPTVRTYFYVDSLVDILFRQQPPFSTLAETYGQLPFHTTSAT